MLAVKTNIINDGTSDNAFIIRRRENTIFFAMLGVRIVKLSIPK